MHYLPFGARLNKGILMVTQLIRGFLRFLERFFNDSFIDANGTFSAFFRLEPTKALLPTFFHELYMFL